MSLNELLYTLPKKRLFELREARINRLLAEQEEMKKEEEKRQQLRPNI